MTPIINISEGDFERARKLLELSNVDYSVQSSKLNEFYTIPKPNIVKSDYIKLGIEDIENNFDENKGYDIAITRSEFNKNHEEQNISLLEKGLYMSNIKEFMTLHNSIMDSYQNNTPLFDAAGNLLKRNVIKQLYNNFTRDEWINLNVEFEKNNSGFWTIKEAIGLDKNKNINYGSKKILCPITKSCYVDSKIVDEEGLPSKESKKQKFKAGKNIYFWTPFEDSVAGFGAGVDGVSLSCNRYPSVAESDLGVRAVRHE